MTTIAQRLLLRLPQAVAFAVGTRQHTGTIVRPPAQGTVPDGQGGWLPGTPTRIGPFPCMYRALATVEGRRAASTEIAALGSAEVDWPPGTGLLETDQLEIDLHDGAPVLVLEVAGINPAGPGQWLVVATQELHPT